MNRTIGYNLIKNKPASLWKFLHKFLRNSWRVLEIATSLRVGGGWRKEWQGEKLRLEPVYGRWKSE